MNNNSIFSINSDNTSISISSKEFKKVIEWEIFNEFKVDNYRLKIIC